MAHANGANSSLGLYVNARLVALVQGLAAWSFSQKAMNFGGTATNNVESGSLFSSVAAFKGTAIPRPGSMEATKAVEGDYYDGATLVSGSGTAVYDLNNADTDSVSGGGVMTLAGGAAFEAPPPGGTVPLRPWEWPQP